MWSTDQGSDLWTWDLERRILTPVTRDPLEDQHPVWTRNGQRIVFSSNRGGRTNLWWQAADGSSPAVALTTTGDAQFPTSLTADGKGVVFFELTPTNGRDLMQVGLDGTHDVKSVLQTPFHEREASVSPDGHWLAYESNRSGPFEVWVSPFPAVDTSAFRISTDGGTRALWAPDSRTLFYIGGDGFLQAVAVDPKGSAWHNGPSTRVFERRYYIGGNSGRSYDISRDRRLLMIRAPSNDTTADPPGLIVVQHWGEELKRLVATK